MNLRLKDTGSQETGYKCKLLYNEQNKIQSKYSWHFCQSGTVEKQVSQES